MQMSHFNKINDQIDQLNTNLWLTVEDKPNETESPFVLVEKGAYKNKMTLKDKAKHFFGYGSAGYYTLANKINEIADREIKALGENNGERFIEELICKHMNPSYEDSIKAGKIQQIIDWKNEKVSKIENKCLGVPWSISKIFSKIFASIKELPFSLVSPSYDKRVLDIFGEGYLYRKQLKKLEGQGQIVLKEEGNFKIKANFWGMFQSLTLFDTKKNKDVEAISFLRVHKNNSLCIDNTYHYERPRNNKILKQTIANLMKQNGITQANYAAPTSQKEISPKTGLSATIPFDRENCQDKEQIKKILEMEEAGLKPRCQFTVEQVFLAAQATSLSNLNVVKKSNE